jgi:signal transduction histidine kinase
MSDVRVNCVPRLSDALASLDVETPSLVLLDLNLPDSHGAATFHRIMQKAPHVPVVILSGHNDEALAINAVHQGVQDYLVKGDITSKQLERAVRYAVERQAILRSLEITRKQQIEFKNRFLSHISHELRTPLTCIHQYVTLLLDGLAGPLAPNQTDHLKTALKSVNQLHAMIRDLLEATRADSGKLRVEPRCIDVGELIQQAVAMMGPAAAERRLALEAMPDQTIPLVYADPGRVIEVLINLIDNAIKFTPPEGAVLVKAEIVETDPTLVRLSVSDSGRGIPAELLPQVFDRLYQDPGAVDNNRTGLGLGLYIAKEIVTLHGGSMWVASQPGSGSTFSFTLPLFSLAKLLLPVITYQERLRDSIVLVRVELTPRANSLGGSWKETCQRCLELLRRCIFVDKDLVLPSTGSGPGETFFVVASTDMAHVDIMMERIRNQMSALPRLKTSGTLRVTVEKILDRPPAIREVWKSKLGWSLIASPTSSSTVLPANKPSKKRRNTRMRTENKTAGQPLTRPKIMVVDDDPDLRHALSLRLRANNFETVNVGDGYSAIALAKKERPQLIILDLGLPAGGGFTVLKNLRRYPALADTPVIVLTARDPEGNEKQTLESGAIAFFQKPADNDELLGVIRASLQAGGWGRALPPPA